MVKATFSQGFQVQKLINDKYPTDEELQALIESGIISFYFEARRSGKEITSQMLREFFGETSEVYNISVDYNISLDEMIKAGKYDWINKDITLEHFRTKGEDKQELAITILHFNHYISSDDAIKEMEMAGYRPVVLPELLALGASQPELQRQFPIVALGSGWQNRHGDRCVSYLWRGGVERYLLLHLFEHGWDPDYRFAVARK